MDLSLHNIRKALTNSCDVKTNIQTWPIEAFDRKKQYRNFLNESQGTELIGFMPLQNTIISNRKFISDTIKMFSKGVQSPGRLYPFFGNDAYGICISRRLDCVFTVMEEGIAHWVLVCAVAFNDSHLQETDLFCKPDVPPQAMKWNKKVRLDGESVGWRRPFECIENMLYVGEGIFTGSYPRNVLPLAVAKVHFGRTERIESSCFFLNKPHRPMEVKNQMLQINKLITMKGGNETTVFDGMSMFGVTIYSRYEIEPTEWPERLYFDNYDIFPCVFQSWIVDGKLDMQKLANEGNIKMLTNFFYDHSFKSCSKPHPSHVYLNYYQVEAPKERMIEMMNTLIDLESRDMVLFGCYPLITFFGHVIYAAIPPGEIANRLGLPSIVGDRFHLIQALPLPTGTLHTIDRATEMIEFYTKRPEHIDDRSKEVPSMDLITLSDSDDGEERYENRNISSKKTRDEMVISPSISYPLPHENNDRYDDSSFVDNSMNIDGETTREKEYDTIEMDVDEEEEERSRTRRNYDLVFSFENDTPERDDSSMDYSMIRREERRRKGLTFAFDDSMDSSTPPPPSSHISSILPSTVISPPLLTPSSHSSIHNENRIEEIEIDGEFSLPLPDSSDRQQLVQNGPSNYNDHPVEKDNYESIAMDMDDDEEDEEERRRRMRNDGLVFSFEDDIEDDSMEILEETSRNESRSFTVQNDTPERLKSREGKRRNETYSFSFEDSNESRLSPSENINEERRSHRKERRKRKRSNEKEKKTSSRHRRSSRTLSFMEEDDDDIVALSPPRKEKSKERGFRPLKISAAQRARNARISSPRESRSVDTIDITSSPRASSSQQNGFSSTNISTTQFAPIVNPLNSRSDDTIVILSPPRNEASHQGFRPLKTSSSQSTRNAPRRTSKENVEEMVVWNRKRNESPLESLTRLPFATMVIVMDDQLIKQMKLDEMNVLVKLINEYSSDEKNRIVLVLHFEFETDNLELPRQLKNIDPFAVFIMKHKAEANVDDLMNCCEKVRKMGRNERADIVYLTPNANPTLMKNNQLGKMGYKVFNTSGVVSYLQSKRYEEDY